MTRRKVASVFICLILTSLSCAGDSVADLNVLLQKAFVGKVVSLKTPCKTDKLRYAQDGQPVGTCEPVPWTTYGVVNIRNVKLDTATITFEGTRCVVGKEKDGKIVPINTNAAVTVKMDLPPGASAETVTDDLNKVIESATLEDRFAMLWKENAGRYDPAVAGVLDGHRMVYSSTGKVDVKPPRAIYSPAPFSYFNDDAPPTGDKPVVAVVISDQGYPEIIELLKSVNDNLDRLALAAVSRWRFKPATKNNVPVSVKVVISF